MLAKYFIGLCLAGCLGGGALPAAQAQTGRITHYSHGGSAATLAAIEEAADNFGGPYYLFRADSVRYLSDRKLVQYGKWNTARRKETTDTLQLPKKMSAAEAARYLRFSNAVEWADESCMRLVGFDSTSKGHSGQRVRPTKIKRKAAATYWLPSLPPNGPGLALLTLAGLAGAGWLLAGPRPRLTSARA